MRPNEVVKLPHSLSVPTFNDSLLKSPRKINYLSSFNKLSMNSSNQSLNSTLESSGLNMLQTKNGLLLAGEISNKRHNIF